MPSDVVIRRPEQTVLLTRIDARGPIAECVVGAETHFDENEFAPIAHDQVNFTAAYRIVSLHDAQTAPGEITGSGIFYAPAGVAR